VANLTVMKTTHARLPRPSVLGRVIGIPHKADIQEALSASGTRH
jgi:acyl-CoA thioester hydrolase